LEREYDLEKDQRKRQFEDELKDIQRQRDIRLRELQIEYAFRRKEMEQEFLFEQALREKEHARRIAEEKQQAKERFAELLRTLQDEGILSAKEAKAVGNIFDSVFGEDGQIAKSLDELIEKIRTVSEEVAEEIQRIRESISGFDKMMEARQAVTFLAPEGPVVPDELKTLEGFDFDIDEGAVANEAQKITDAIAEEFGPDGKVREIFDYLADDIQGLLTTEIPEALQDTGELVNATDVISNIFGSVFGKDGVIDTHFIYLGGAINSVISSVIDAINKLRNALASLRGLGQTSSNTNVGGGPKKAAEGGTYFANRPTTITFGEAGWEMAEFTPLDKPGQNVGKMFGEGISSRNDRIELMVRMQDGLIAEIVDTTLDQTATVILNVERARL